MGKTVSHYRDKFSSIAGQHAKVSAWRGSDGAVHYRVKCLLCADSDYHHLGWESTRRMWDPEHGAPTPPADFHAVMRRWVTHMLVSHSNFHPPKYSFDMDAAAEAEWRREERCRDWYQSALREARVLDRVFERDRN